MENKTKELSQTGVTEQDGEPSKWEEPKAETAQAEEAEGEETQPQIETAFEGSKHIPMFPTNVFEFGVKNAAELDKDITEGLSKIENPSGLPNWSSTAALHLTEDFEKLEDNILKAAEETFGFLKYSFNELIITTLTANTVTEPDRSPAETHSNNILSGLYCLKAGGGKIILNDPRLQAWNIRPNVSEVGIFNSDVFVMDMVETKMLVYPAWLQRYMVFPEGETSENIYFTFSVMLSS